MPKRGESQKKDHPWKVPSFLLNKREKEARERARALAAQVPTVPKGRKGRRHDT